MTWGYVPDGSANPAIDEFGKVTVSLGAHCPLACAHCYTTAPGFHVDQKRAVDDALSVVGSLPAPTMICLSGDTDPFLRPAAAMDFLERAADRFGSAHIMFTTRLIPPSTVLDRVLTLGRQLANEGRLLAAAVSLVSADYPNALEDAKRVPSTEDRQGLLADLANGPQPVMLALRPTLPFSIVGRSSVQRMIERAAGSAAAVLGEVLLLDGDGAIADRLGIRRDKPDDEIGVMSFLNQPTLWRKRRFPEESAFAAQEASRHGLPYFMRSISATRYFARYWDLAAGRSRYKPDDPLDLGAETVAP